MLVCPERAVNVTKCDLNTVVERLAFHNGPYAVLHNLRYVELLKKRFTSDLEIYFK